MYLLDTQQVMDLFSRDSARPISRWLKNTKPGRSDLFVSVLSLGQIAHAIEDMKDVAERNHWRRLNQEGRRELEGAGSVIDIDAGIVEIWHTNLRDGRLSIIGGAESELGEDDRLIFATAISRGYALVTEISPLLSEISARTTLTLIEP